MYNDGKKVKPNWGQTGRPMIVDHDRLNVSKSLGFELPMGIFPK
jgi:hypothetical protein